MSKSLIELLSLTLPASHPARPNPLLRGCSKALSSWQKNGKVAGERGVALQLTGFTSHEYQEGLCLRVQEVKEQEEEDENDKGDGKQ